QVYVYKISYYLVLYQEKMRRLSKTSLAGGGMNRVEKFVKDIEAGASNAKSFPAGACNEQQKLASITQSTCE
nr:hypothetical protein [Phycisphaerae bacterium]